MATVMLILKLIGLFILVVWAIESFKNMTWSDLFGIILFLLAWGGAQ